MLGWLCIVQSPCAYTPGIRAGAECGAAALTPLGATPQTLFLNYIVFRQTFIYLYISLLSAHALYSVTALHIKTEIVKQLLCGVVAHLFLSVVHRRNFEYNGKVTSGFYRDSK